MSGDTTIYDIRVRYGLDGVSQAASGLNDFSRSAKGAESSLFSLKSAVMAVGASFLAGGLKHALIDANSEVESLRIGFGTMLAMNLGEPFERAYAASGRLFDKIEEIAKVTPKTTSEVARLYGQLVGVTTQSGGSANDALGLTKGAVTAGTAFGIGSDQVGVEIQQMLHNGVQARNRFGMMLMGGDRQKFNAADQHERLGMLEQKLESPALQAAAKKFGDSWQGQLTTIESNLQRVFRAVGLPLMREMTAQLKSWNAYLSSDAGKARMAEFAHDFSSALVRGFHAVQAAGEFIVQHRELLLHIAEIFLALKGASMIGGSIGGVVKGLLSLGGAAGGAVTALVLAGAAIYVFRDQIANAATSVGGIYETAKRIKEQAENRSLPAGAVQAIEMAQRSTRRVTRANEATAAWSEWGAKTIANVAAEAILNEKNKEKADPAKPRPISLNVNIEKVVSEDPDKWADDLDDRARKTVEDPTEAASAWRRPW